MGFALFARLAIFAADANAGFSDGVDRNDPNFVRASLLIMSPGQELFSCVGHAALRLECPTFKLDNCFSYESERAVDRLLAFFAGRLKMGMFTVKTEDFRAEYREDGRGVVQYQLNLPPKVKQRLWKQMDDQNTQKISLPYDYMQRGCAKSVLDSLKAAFAPTEMRGPLLPITQRETFNCELAESHPWNLFFLNAIVGTETDTFAEVVTPKNLVRFLSNTQVNGVPIIADTGYEILPRKLTFTSVLISPFVAAWLVFALVVLVYGRGMYRAICGRGVSPRLENAGDLHSDAARRRVHDSITTIASTWLVRTLLVSQALAGCFFVFLVSASHLPNSGWNWLLVPFNPVMPIVAVMAQYSWCRVRWLLLVCVLALVGWVVFMLCSPHAKTDPAYIVLAAAYGLLYGRLALTRTYEKRGKR